VLDEQEEEVNAIIMKIELKKFQKLIENRIQKKNSLLNADVKRLYPICTNPAMVSNAQSDIYKID
jgi:ferritin-like protein